MPVKKIKELHLASSLDELRRKTEIKDINHDVKILIRSAKHVLENAHTSLLEGDEEKSYILFMKFVELALHMKNKKKLMCEGLNKYFGCDSLKNAVENLEELGESLSFRYAQKGAKEGKTIQGSVVKPKLIEENGNSGENAKSSPNSGASELYHDSAVSIKSLELRNLIQEGKFHILLVDTRSGKDFAESHMCFTNSSMVFPGGSALDRATIISIPQEVIKKGLAPMSLRKELPPESISDWDRRAEFDLVVLLDWDTYLSSIKMDSSIFILKDIIDRWDIYTKYKRNPVVLDGGYYDWVNTFPMLTTNSRVDPPTKQRSLVYAKLNEDKYLAHLVNDDDDLDDLDDVEYPAIIDSPPKPAPVSEPASGTLSSLQAAMNAWPVIPESRLPPPLVDRSSKPSAVPTSPQKPSVALQPTLKKVSDIPPASSNDMSQEEIPKEVTEEKAARDTQAPSERNEPPSAQTQMPAREEPKDISENTEVRKSRPFSPSDDAPERRPAKNVYIPAIDRSLKAKVLQTQVHHGGDGEGISPSSSFSLPAETLKPNITGSKSFEPKKIDTVRRDSVDKVNEEMKNFEPFPGDGAEERKPEKKKKGGDTWFTPLKSEPSPGSSAMKRSHSLQNVSRLTDDQECPKFNRSAKPASRTTEIIATRRRTFDGVYGKVGRGLTGLRNLGNSCYMNSILQCINHTKSLVEYFCDGQYREDVNRGTKLRGEVAEEVAALVRALWSGEYRSIACRDLKGVVGMHKKAFAGHEQQDSHEFLTILMDWLHEDLNRASLRASKIGNKQSNPSAQNASGPEGAERAWHDFCRQNESLVLHLFYGQQASTVCCLQCGEQSVTYEPFSNLSLPIPPNATRCSLADCMALYLKGEHISGWNCPKCKEPRDASKKFDIWILPRILVIHFKRFTSDGWCRKRQTMVDFPLQDLDASQWVGSEVLSSGYNPTRRRNSVLYNLYGVSNHYGTMDGGHYTAHCKSSTFNKWFKFDDQEVSELSPSEVVSPAAYILFYSSVDVS